MKENDREDNNLIEINTKSENKSKIESNKQKLDKKKTTLSDWQMYQLAISSVALRITFSSEDLCSHIPEHQHKDFSRFFNFYMPCDLPSQLLYKKSYSYKVFFSKHENQKRGDIEISNYEKNQLVRNWLNKRQIIAKRLHRVLQIINDYDDYCFVQGPSSLSLRFDALETRYTDNTLRVDFQRDRLEQHIDKKRIVSCYQTLSFYDYDYFYKDKAPNETAVDFWLAMDRFLEEPYLTQQNLYGENSGLSLEAKEHKKQENANKKDKLRNYVHRIMIVPDELLNDNEKKFRAWVRNSDNQQKFIEIYKKTFNRVPKTGLKKIEVDIESQKENVESKLLFCKQKMTFKNLGGQEETKFVYSLKLLEDNKWVEYPKNKYQKYVRYSAYDQQSKTHFAKNLGYELNDEQELYIFPNMEYLTYLLHASPNELSNIEKEFVEAFLDRSADGAFSLGVRMHKENVKQYVHDNLITKRENWKLEESDLSAQDIKILNILNDDDRINEFNESVEEIYNADLVKNLWDEAQEEYGSRFDFDWLKFLKFLVVTFVFAIGIFLALKFIFDVVAIWALITFPIAPILIFSVCTFVFRNKFDLINRYFDTPTDEPEQYDIAKEMYKTLQICNKKEIEEKNKLPVTITFNYPKFFKGLSVALVVSLLIFLALKFIFDVVALWALIVFPVAPIIIFLVCVFFLRNKFKETTCLHKIEAPIPGDENRFEPKIVKAYETIIEAKESTSQENNTFKKDDKEYPGN